jgi:outer membrane receptor protein involved in Fe transport
VTKAFQGILAFAACGVMCSAVPVCARQTSSTADSATKPPADGAPKDATSKDSAPTVVTVTGKKAQSRVDRQVYDVSKNIDSQTGSAADTLGKVPGVSVDPTGNVTLRGQNVRIYLNGRPSLMLSGDNRGQALQAMPSAYLSSVEVISNPGSQYASGSSDPIINIVTKRKAPPGMFGSTTVRANSTGRGQVTNWTSYTNGDLNISAFGSLYGSVTPDSRRGSDLKAFDSTGALTAETQSNGASLSHDHGVFIGINLENDFGVNDVVTGGVTYNHGSGDYAGQGHTKIYDATGQATDIHSSSSLGDYMYGSQGLTFGYTHYGQKPDETLKIDGSLSSSQNRSASQNDVTYVISPIATNVGTRVDTKSHDGDARNATLSADYNTPLGNDQVAVGAQITHDDNRSRNLAFGPDDLGATLTAQPLLDDDFRYHQTVTAVYGTWQREFTDTWTVLGGLRGESWNLDTRDMGANTRGHVALTRINPSLFATDVLSPKQKLRFSYVHRQQRPDASDLNPHLVYNASTSVTLGNPALKPQENDTFEGGYEYQDDKLSYAVRSFYRFDNRLIAATSVFIPDPQAAGNQVLETTRENFSHQSADGLTANYNNRLGDKLTLSGDATLTLSATRNPEITGAQKGTSLGGSSALTYVFKNEDQFYVNYKLTGKSFSGQGYTQAYSTTSVQYKHALTPRFDLVVAINDLLRTGKTESVTATPLVHSFSVSSRAAPTFYIALTRHFSAMGAVKPAAN